jgi:hypothetical protein
MVDNKAKDYDVKARHPSQVDCVADSDVEWYLSTQFVPALKRLFEQFGGFSDENITEILEYKPSSKKIFSRAPLRDIFYECPSCKAQYALDAHIFVCRDCKTEMSWKYVCNSLVRSLKELIQTFGSDNEYVCDVCRFRTRQLPAFGGPHLSQAKRPCQKHLRMELQNVEAYRVLKRLLAKCDQWKGPAAEYLWDLLADILNMHGLNRLRITTILRVPPWE